MLSSPRQVCRLQIQCLQRSQTLASHARKSVQKLLQGFALALFLLCKAVKRIKWPRLAMLQDRPYPRHPVSAVANNQVAHNIESAPRIFPFVAMRPDVGQSAQKRVQCCWSSGEKRNRFRHAEFV